MSQYAVAPEPDRREPTNEELALQEAATPTPQVQDDPLAGQALQPYVAAGQSHPPRPGWNQAARWIGPSGFLPTPVFRYREARDSPGCLFGLAAVPGFIALVGTAVELSEGTLLQNWTFVALFAVPALVMLVGAGALARRNADRDRGQG